jgi:GTP-binding protein
MLATLLDRDPSSAASSPAASKSGTLKANMPIKALDATASCRGGRATKVLAFRGLERSPSTAEAGDIVAIAGLTKATVSDTIADPRSPSRSGAADRPADARHDLRGQRQPLAGREGDKVQSRVIRDRLSARPKATSRSA